MIRDAGFEATSLWWEEDDECRRQLRHLGPDLVRRAGLHIDNLHAPYNGCNDLWSANDGDRGIALQRHLGWVEDCARHNVGTLVMHVTQGSGTPPPNDKGLDSIQRVVEAGERANVTIAVENTRSLAHIEWLLEQVSSTQLGLCYDSSHDWLYSQHPGELLRRWGSRVVTTHLSDTDGRRDQHWLPRTGVVDFRVVRENGPWPAFEGCYMLEVVPKNRRQSASAFVQEAYDAARSLASDLVS